MGARGSCQPVQLRQGPEIRHVRCDDHKPTPRSHRPRRLADHSLRLLWGQVLDQVRRENTGEVVRVAEECDCISPNALEAQGSGGKDRLLAAVNSDAFEAASLECLKKEASS